MCEELGQPATRAFVGAVVGSFYCLIGAYDEGEAEARRVVALGECQGMPHWAAQGRCNLGWALTGKGRFDDAVASLRPGLEGLTQVGARASTSYFRAALIEAHLGRGDLPSARAELADLHAFVATSDERFFEAALWWLDGEVTLACQGPDDRGRAEASFRRAVEVARSQGAHALGRHAGERLSLLSGSG